MTPTLKLTLLFVFVTSDVIFDIDINIGGKINIKINIDMDIKIDINIDIDTKIEIDIDIDITSATSSLSFAQAYYIPLTRRCWRRDYGKSETSGGVQGHQ